MANKQEQLALVLELLKPKYNIVGDPDEFGMELMAKDGTHKATIRQSGVSFSSLTNSELSYSYGFTHMPEIRNFVRNTPSFDEETYAKYKEENEGGVHKKRSQTLIKEAKKVAKAPAEDKGPSVRGTIFQMLEEGKDRAAILAVLKTLKSAASRDDKSLLNQISLNSSQFKARAK